MYIVPSKKIGFVHLQRTGGTSILYLLKEFAGPTNRYGRGHSRISRSGRRKFRDYFIFTMIRNPFDRIVSWYEWRKANDHKRKILDFRSFVRYIDDCHFRNVYQLRKLQDSRGQILVDFIGCYDTYKEDIVNAFQKGGVRICDDCIPHENGTIHKHYSNYYDEETKCVVSKKFKDEIDYFGFRFEWDE